MGATTDPTKPDKTQRGKEYRAKLGLVIANWQAIEMQLELIFTILLSPVNAELSATVYESIFSIESKINAIDRVMQIRFKRAKWFLDVWAPIAKTAHELRVKRNEVAHFFMYPWPPGSGSDPDELYLVRSFFAELLTQIKDHRPRRKPIQWPADARSESNIADTAARMFSFGKTLQEFAYKLDHALASPDTSSVIQEEQTTNPQPDKPKAQN